MASAGFSLTAPEQNSPGNIEIVRDDDFRIKHIKVKGLPTEALAAMNELDGNCVWIESRQNTRSCIIILISISNLRTIYSTGF